MLFRKVIPINDAYVEIIILSLNAKYENNSINIENNRKNSSKKIK
jgi:hypothetical protein